jgi:4-hydroxybenzoate polyprenyltransferase
MGEQIHSEKMPTAGIKDYLSLIKFSHTIFALPFALLGFFLASQYDAYGFEWVTFVLVLLCMVFARSAAMAFNRYIDRDIDKENPRTAEVREIPKGVISPRSALGFVIVNCILFITTTYFINDICFYLSPIALAVVLGYSYTKRFTALCHLVLGLGLALAPTGAYLAVSGVFDEVPILISFAVLFWVSGFDIIYALQDDQFDKAYGLNSIPSTLGRKNALALSILFHLITSFFLAWAGWSAGFGWFYWIGWAVFSFLMIYQHSLVKADDLSKVNLAFFTTNGIASLIFGGLAILEIFLN